jgi:hypothetical protein
VERTTGGFSLAFQPGEPSADPIGEFADSRKEILCRSYTPLLARSNSTSKRLPTPIATGRTTARNAKTTGPLTGHGFYSRTLVDVEFDGVIRVRRYLCRWRRRRQCLQIDARSSQPMYGRRWLTWERRPTITNFASKS